MANNITQLKIGSRGSSLALVQTKLVIEALKKIPEIKKNFSFKIIKIKTQGDIDKSKILDSGYKGFFTKKIDDFLLKKKKLILQFTLQKIFHLNFLKILIYLLF